MALQTELISILDNPEEPLIKRLKIATDVFSTNELPAFNKETVLFNWFGKTCLKEDTIEVWNTLHECITSTHMKNISTSEIKHNVLHTVVKAVIKQLKKDSNNKQNVLKCGIAILNNEMFQQYFKHDLKQFCGLISGILLNAQDINIVKEVLAINLLFIDKNFDKTEYISNFLSSTFDAFINVIIKFNDDEIYADVLKLIKRILFSFNLNDFVNFVNQAFEHDNQSNNTNNIFEKLKSLYNSDVETAKIGFKLIFLSSLTICTTELIQYKLFVLLVHTLGFKIKKLMKLNLPKNTDNFDFEKSLEIFNEILFVIYNKNITIAESINEITFSDFLKSLIVSIIRIQTYPSKNTLKILIHITDIDPLIIESSIDEILNLIISFKKVDNIDVTYSELMIAIMKLFFKLRRVKKFYDVLSETLHNKIFSNTKPAKADIKFSGEIVNTSSDICSIKELFPENVRQYFQDCITLQPINETSNILQTCINNIKQVADNIQSYADDQKVHFVQFISEIACNVLSGMKLGDNTTTEQSVNKHVENLNTLREELKNFGTALLTVEHNHLLMFSFLNIAYIWAEVAMLIKYYMTPENLNFKNELKTDTSINNLTYLHNYLTSEQWILILQRIKNFGEQPCKHILQKLLIQKLRAMVIFEDEVDDKIETAVITSYANNLETSWNILLTDKFIGSSFVPKMESSHLVILADHLINHMIEKNNFEILVHRNIIDSRDLITAVFYVTLSKICNLFKKKRKHEESTYFKPICTKIFKSFDENCFIKYEVVNIDTIVECFIESNNDIKDFKLKEESFCTFMEIIRKVPVPSLSPDLQVSLFLYLLSICYELRNCRTQNAKCLEKCEEYLYALVENNLSSPNLATFVKPTILIKYVIESCEKYKDILSKIIGKCVTQNDSIPSFKSIISLVEKNILDTRYSCVIYTAINVLNNPISKNVSEDNKKIIEKYKEKIVNKFFKQESVKEATTNDELIKYILLLQYHLKTSVAVDDLIPVLSHNINYAVENINENNAEEFLLFFKLLLIHQNTINVNCDLGMQAWNACKKLKDVDKHKQFQELIPKIFNTIPFEKFTIIIQELLEINLNYIKSNQPENSINQIKLWKNLIKLHASEDKTHFVIKMVQPFLSNLALFSANNKNLEFNKEFVNFQLFIIENVKGIPSPAILDMNFQTTHMLISNCNTLNEFLNAFEIGIQILESLVKYHKVILADRLPTFLLHFRLYFQHLCANSNSDVETQANDLTRITNCAFVIEKIVRNICLMKKDVSRIIPYLIADFLKEYEKVPIHANVKAHFNNCMMELLRLCDSHGASHLLRVLSPASTELFKEFNYVYKKYFKFSGKV